MIWNRGISIPTKRRTRSDSFGYKIKHVHGMIWEWYRGSRGKCFISPCSIAHTKKCSSLMWTVGSLLNAKWSQYCIDQKTVFCSLFENVYMLWSRAFFVITLTQLMTRLIWYFQRIKLKLIQVINSISVRNFANSFTEVFLLFLPSTKSSISSSKTLLS